jgi:hypothetical protein
MNKLILALSIACLFGMSVLVSGQTTPVPLGQFPLKGYVSLGRNIVVLPEQLRAGDKILITDIKGRTVLQENLKGGYIARNIAEIPQGVYTLIIIRKNSIVGSVKVPII